MKRRTLLKGLLAVAAMAPGFRLPLVNAADSSGKLFVFVQADGGWDPTSFCDPKSNTRGEPVINHWAQHDDVRQVGNILYAPFANNVSFFEKYYRRMLVINGVDAQTNSHTVGIVHNWSGRNSEGYPTLSALLAAHYAPNLPIPYLSFGGFSVTAGITRFTRIDRPQLLRAIADPSTHIWDPELQIIGDEDWASLEAYRAAAAERPAAVSDLLLPAEARHLAFYRSAFDPEGFEGLRRYSDAMPPEDQLEREELGPNNFRSSLRQQAQLTVLAFKTGVAVSADLWLGGFDTHSNHDQDHEWLLGRLTAGVDYLWDYAEAHGVADRMVVVMGSDFGRTNFYNGGNGKDHWPIGSYIVMEKNQSWTNQVVGETDELHFAYSIDWRTLRRVETGGTILYPKHIHKALRSYLGIEGSSVTQPFPFHNTEDCPFFS